ncbi:MAG: YbfB/YjiJ family MFS transporter [Xanthobacteraceae bacterium]|nr:YbfB/YjiJ family MFS transporter [Xanthobacteraceae bacterium]
MTFPKSPTSQGTSATRLILTLALAPTIGLGIGRFAYSLVLPDMRESLGWTYAAAGFMNTINAAGYLGGALIASRLCNRYGLARVLRDGTLACMASLVLSGLSGNFLVLSFARLLIGVGAAVAFVAGGAMAARLAQSHPARASLLLSLFYAGPGFGIFASGLLAPFMLQVFGPGSWWTVWLAMAAISAVMMAVLLANPVDMPSTLADANPGRFAIRPVLIYLSGYFLFGVGYIAYMTFMIAFVRDAGGGAAAQSAFWCLIGLSAFTSPWVWRGVLARGHSGVSTALILACNATGAGLPLLSQSPAMLALSALIFGVAFFAVVTATTAFVRFNYPAAQWPAAIAAMTIAFGIGQTLGPIGTGLITDATGSLTSGLAVSAALLVVGALASAFQKPLAQPTPDA